jgi:hypothetical protein
MNSRIRPIHSRISALDALLFSEHELGEPRNDLQ